MIDIERVETLARVLDSTPVVELLLVDHASEIRFVRDPARVAVAPSPVVEDQDVAPSGPEEHLIFARRVGVYHKPPRSIQPGDTIQEGEVVGHIEAMRIPNDIVAEVGGIVTQVFIEDGSPVEYGQELLMLQVLAPPPMVDEGPEWVMA